MKRLTARRLSERGNTDSEIMNRPDSSDEYVIDPITMRRVLKTPPSSSPQGTARKAEVSARTEAFNIPVKTFRTSEKASQVIKPNKRVHPTIQKLELEGQDWLSQEGFGTPTPLAKASASEAPQKSTKIESALERHLNKDKLAAIPSDKKNQTALEYNPVESKTEDLDLLTASDIRASAGRLSKPAKETAKEKQERREALENDYEKQPDTLDKRLEAEMSASRQQSEKEMMDELESIAKDVRKRDMARTVHEQEVNAQKAAMEAHEAHRPVCGSPNHTIQPGEGDMALNVHEFVSRDRWYKQKAPHASAESEQKLLQATKDRAFVREIRSIYEDTHGTIDTQHRQQATTQPTEDSDYPGDAYPGTLYEQPWTANVLNDHPEIDSPGGVPVVHQPDSQNSYEQQRFQALSLIGKLFGELRENQALLQENHAELLKLPAKDQSISVYQSLKTHEQRVMHTLKVAHQALIKSAPTKSSDAPSDISDGKVGGFGCFNAPLLLFHEADHMSRESFAEEICPTTQRLPENGYTDSVFFDRPPCSKENWTRQRLLPRSKDSSQTRLQQHRQQCTRS